MYGYGKLYEDSNTLIAEFVSWNTLQAYIYIYICVCIYRLCMCAYM